MAARPSYRFRQALVLGAQHIHAALRVREGLEGLPAHLDADERGAARRRRHELRDVVVRELRHAAPRRDGVRLVVLLLEARADRERERRAELRRGPPQHARVARGLASHHTNAEVARLFRGIICLLLERVVELGARLALDGDLVVEFGQRPPGLEPRVVDRDAEAVQVDGSVPPERGEDGLCFYDAILARDRRDAPVALVLAAVEVAQADRTFVVVVVAVLVEHPVGLVRTVRALWALRCAHIVCALRCVPHHSCTGVEARAGS